MKVPSVKVPSVLCAVTFLAYPLGAQQAERHRLAGNDLAVYNLVGTLTVGPGTGPDVVVEVTRGGADAAQLRVEIGMVRGRNTLRILFPDDDIVYSRDGRRGRGGWNTTLRVNDDGTFGHGQNEGRRIRISSRGDGVNAWADVRVLVPGGKSLRAGLGAGQVTANGVTGDLWLQASAGDIDVTETAGRLRLESGSGGISLAQGSGTISVHTGSGEIGLSDVKGDRLHGGSGSGSLTLRGADFERVELQTGSGSIRASAVTARDIELSTGSGGVSVEALTRPDRVEVETGSGSVTVTLPENFGATVRLETGSGGIDLGGMSVTGSRIRRNRVSGTTGDGRGTLTVETGSGSIKVQVRSARN